MLDSAGMLPAAAKPSLNMPSLASRQIAAPFWAHRLESVGLEDHQLWFLLLGLERLNVRSLPPLGALYHVKLHGLTLLQTLEATRVDCRVVHEYIFAVLARNEAEALRVIKPLHSTLFHFVRIS
jgi:hypothetical protein